VGVKVGQGILNGLSNPGDDLGDKSPHLGNNGCYRGNDGGGSAREGRNGRKDSVKYRGKKRKLTLHTILINTAACPKGRLPTRGFRQYGLRFILKNRPICIIFLPTTAGQYFLKP